MVKSNGVDRLLFSATYASEKSWVISARSMAPVANAAAIRISGA